MQNILERRGVRQFVKFGVVGATSTALDWGIYLFLTRFFGIFYLMAKVLSFLLSIGNSFFWNRRWTFRSKDPARINQFSKFMVVAGVGLGLNTLIMYVVVSRMGLHDIIGLIFATGIVMFWNFSVNKYWTFKEVSK